MRDKIESANRLAAAARKKSLECADQREKEAWTKIASMWDELAREYRDLQRARDQL
jgi:hypothetical protein